MTMNFNDAKPQQDSGGLIPEGTIVTAIMTLRPGGFGDDGYEKKANPPSTNTMLDAEFTVTPSVGGFERRKVWQYFVLGGDALAVSRSMLRAALESAHGIKPTDDSSEAQAKRAVPSYAAFDGLPVCIKVGIEKGTNGYADKNRIRAFVTPDKKEYVKPEGTIPNGKPGTGQAHGAQSSPSTGGNGSASKPAWAG